MYPKITFTCTTFNRLKLFIETMDTFLDTCLDKYLISEWLVGDDGSSYLELQMMQKRYPFLKILQNPKKGQASNINHLWSHVNTEWFFHCEDDWHFHKSDTYIKHLFDVVFDDEKIRNATLRHWEPDIIKTTRSGVRYGVHRYLPDTSKEAMRKADSWWCGYTLNPGLQHKPTVEILGRYDESYWIGSRYWDRPQAIRYYELGFKRGNLMGHYIEHIGEGQSAYNLRGRERVETSD